jgi:hypothetical protein
MAHDVGPATEIPLVPCHVAAANPCRFHSEEPSVYRDIGHGKFAELRLLGADFYCCEHFLSHNSSVSRLACAVSGLRFRVSGYARPETIAPFHFAL